jgi:acyl-homoserine-lactone acylase
MKINKNLKTAIHFCLVVSFLSFTQNSNQKEIKRLQKLAKQVTIIRDNWGIPHVYGKTDADAVFGLLYAQCEDDFKRIEMNYIEKMGRLAEVKGSSSIFMDLEMRLLIDEKEAVADYKKAAHWLKKLLQAYADGINFYLYNHPEVKPLLLNYFEQLVLSFLINFGKLQFDVRFHFLDKL